MLLFVVDLLESLHTPQTPERYCYHNGRHRPCSHYGSWAYLERFQTVFTSAKTLVFQRHISLVTFLTCRRRAPRLIQQSLDLTPAWKSDSASGRIKLMDPCRRGIIKRIGFFTRRNRLQVVIITKYTVFHIRIFHATHFGSTIRNPKIPRWFRMKNTRCIKIINDSITLLLQIRLIAFYPGAKPKSGE